MVPRYSRPDMVAIWTPEARFKIWFEIEAHATDALAELGVVPKEAAAAIWEKGAFEVDRIDEIERETKHDVIAFLTNVAEHVGPEARFMHQGMTSSDVLDTCLAVQLAKASDILIADLDALLVVLERRAREHKMTPTIGRSHGIHAEPRATGRGWWRRARTSRPARSRARWGRSRISIRSWKSMSRASSGCWSSRSRRRSFRAIAMRCSLQHWA
jgi:adenylosuccinate lyase